MTTQLLTADEAAERLRISKRGFYRLGLNPVRIGKNRALYRATDLERLINGNEQPSLADMRRRAFARFNNRRAA